jgi:hypothetical protein
MGALRTKGSAPSLFTLNLIELNKAAMAVID